MRRTNSTELITKEFTGDGCGRAAEELPNDFLPGNCPAVNFPVPVIFRKAIRDHAFERFAAASERSTVEISSFVILLVLSIACIFFDVFLFLSLSLS